MSALKRNIERAWAKHLDEFEGVEVAVFASRRDEEVEPPYVVCTVASMRETVPRANVYRAQLDIVLVSHIDDGGPEAPEYHSAQWAAIKKAVDSVPYQARDDEENVHFHGWSPVQAEPAKDAQHYADVLSLVMGATLITVADAEEEVEA